MGTGEGRDAHEARSAVDELITARDLVRWAASRFEEHGLHYGHGTGDAVDEAVWLVSHALHLSPALPEPLWDARLTRAERETVVGRVVRRWRERVPVAYLTGEAWFAGLRFRVDERVLVPRSPFAELVEARFEPWIDASRVRRIAEVGTGSGCIAVACAVAFPEATVWATDVSEAALEVAAINVREHGVGDRVRLERCDVLAGLDGPFDLVVSNPPYVPAASMESLAPEYRHEPRPALEAGPDGLDVVRVLLRDSARCLDPGGALFVEVGEAREHLEAAFPDTGFRWIELERGGEGLFVLDAAELPGRT